MMDFLLDPLNKWLNGKKTILGIFAGIVAFLSTLSEVLSDGIQVADLNVIMAGVSALLVAIGLGHKAQKIEETLKK